ncbi:peptidase domain-containing ABC transporter [Synechococcus sp. YX-04-1]|uniref:peptidase domain-containing ABC transporter n=1 Tax=Synechococcus sp. YX-04-1 TaxID=3062778 RepID=UPI0026E2A556|nr:peptidase domain-containing ABC transporter [Synechococcus sp. YX-04-1]MDO6351170.1 peptidase domain-containing ABC transporter [Synechococcus sp. YX-04-1]
MQKDYLEKIVKSVSQQNPYAHLSAEESNLLFKDSKLIKFSIGEIVLRPDEISSCCYLLISGECRLLVRDPSTDESITIDRRGSGQLLGWASLLRAGPCEWAMATNETIALQIDSALFLNLYRSNERFASFFESLSNLQESYLVAALVCKDAAFKKLGWNEDVKQAAQLAKTLTISFDKPFTPPDSSYLWHVSSNNIHTHKPGTQLAPDELIPKPEGFLLKCRVIGFPKAKLVISNEASSSLLNSSAVEHEDLAGASLTQLGILEPEKLDNFQKYPVIYGKGPIKEVLAVLQMIAEFNSVPIKRDVLERILEDRLTREKPINLQLMAKLCDLIGLKSTIANVEFQHISNLEVPSILFIENVPNILFSINHEYAVIACPRLGIKKISLQELSTFFDDSVDFVLAKRTDATPSSQFGWSWFTPLIQKYKKSLILVFVASLFAQMFALAIPLLIQQIIDKVLAQGNLSSLNVLGTTMIVLALFQGFLMGLRTFIFVDTTDRMDLSLGSAVIDRLLSLRLSFFEKRPVGELSQRLGELGTIRSFLTGTALVSVLNIIFAVIYLIVMIIYSPLLTAVALSTLPIYVLMVIFVSPIYKGLIRKRAVANAKTQSHLIEVLGGIQTVKAQHFEVTARWKWQDRYRESVDQGFRSTALAATSGEIGKFLNQVGSLLVLWVGMWLILKGELTLGQLIAFRIISGMVLGPLMQLSTLYQGFQAVQLSMERLSDIIDQNPELSREDDFKQIPLPSIKGSIRFENVSFRFKKEGPYQVDNVSLEINPGDFVGIVGSSGSGKSTLMKLLPRLYDPEIGRILIDDYDISKVNLSSLRRQVGIVPQDSLLFEGTISENIALNDPDATSEEIINAAKIACAHDFIMGLGQGYATPLSERGSNLSGGQRQRIAIARTILSNPKLLIMDEATSALDYNTERQLCLNLQKWCSGRTVLFITHRLSSIRSSDLICVMDSGCLVEKGTHASLLSQGGIYSALYSQQGE